MGVAWLADPVLCWVSPGLDRVVPLGPGARAGIRLASAQRPSLCMSAKAGSGMRQGEPKFLGSRRLYRWFIAKKVEKEAEKFEGDLAKLVVIAQLQQGGGTEASR